MVRLFDDACYSHCTYRSCLLCPRPRRGGGGIRRSSASVVRQSVRPSVCLMSRTSALTRKPKGLGRRTLHRGTPGHMRLPQRLQGQKVKSQGGAGAYCGGDLATQLVLCYFWWCLYVMQSYNCDFPLLFNSLFHDTTLNLAREHFES